MKKLLVLFLANYLACLTLLAQQPATTPNYPPTIDPNYVETPIQATAPTNYTAHILMHDGKTHYYIMLNNDIVGLLSDGNYGKIYIETYFKRNTTHAFYYNSLLCFDSFGTI